ncbi:hypothetical protein Megvenef_00946 [Candidatus Megaera venefica]|uniref:Uncharacterized protein n=1 Tax=Candidatus Megaera venefica TaxID=2055910 RepID=A0ABU5NCU3_9RICK|nr:hypothetical protein [Candidatus Megaera venefica]MEA0970977.1 hypothetical protein [Candidatus Megaera venefica]
MAKDEPDFSGRANGLLADINRLVGRIDSYKESIVALKPSPSEEKILHFYGSLSVIEGLGSKAIRENSPSSSIDRLVEVVHKSKNEASRLTSDPIELGKLELNSAKTEAALKGFVLPLSLGGPSNELDNFGLNIEEYAIPMQATKEAILALSNKNIPKEEYAEAIIKKTQEILKNDPKGFPPEKLEQYEKFIAQGKQVQKPSKLSQAESLAVTSAVAKSVDGFINSMTKDAQVVTPILLIDQSIKELEKKGYKFSPETKKEISKQLMPALNSLGSDYLAANNNDLVKELVTSIDKGKSFSSRFSENFAIGSKDLHSVATKISTGHLTKSNEAAEKQYQSRFSKMGANLGSDKNFSQNLNIFLEARGEKPISLEQFKKLSDKELAQHRKADPKEFDKVIFGIGAAPVVDKAKPVVKEVPVEVIVPPKPKKLPEGPPSRPAPRRPISAPPALITPVQVQSAPKLENVSVVVDAIAIGKATAIIDASIKAGGHRITPERVAKITKALAPTLAKLGADYLEKNQAGLTKDLVASLKAGQGYSTSFTGNYTVSTAELGKIAVKMEKQHKPQAKQPVSKVKDAPPKLSPKLAQQASSVGHSHNLPHPPPGRGGQTTKPKTPPPLPPRPKSQGPSGVGGRS